MARIQFRYTVQDQNRGVIQNARVFLYKPGTTVDFAGDAFDSKKGGGTVPNGFATDERGEVEVWLEVPQEVDVVVTDDGGAAYYPGSSSEPFSFPEVRLKGWDLLPALEDLPLGRAPLAPQAGGTVGFPLIDDVDRFYAPSTHVHPTHPGGLRPSLAKQFSLTGTTDETPVVAIRLPAGSLAAGSTFRIVAKFFVTSVKGLSRMLTFKLRLGGVVVGNAWSIKGSDAEKIEEPGVLEGLMTIRTPGALGSAVGELWGWESYSQKGPESAVTGSLASGPIVVDTSASRDLVLTAAWGTAGDDSVLRIDTAYIEQVV